MSRSDIEKLIKDELHDHSNPAKSDPIPTSRSPSVSLYVRPTVAPQQIHSTTRLSEAEGGSNPTYEEEDAEMSPAMSRLSSSTPPKVMISLTPVDNNLATPNEFTCPEPFLSHLPQEAFDDTKLTTMESSICHFHLIAADAEIQLARKLCSIEAADFEEKRRALINEYKRFMEARTSSILMDMNGLHDQSKEKQTSSAHDFLDILADEDRWKRPLPPSTVRQKIASPPTQSKLSDSPLWSPKTPEVPMPRIHLPERKPAPEDKSAVPPFWKPSWDSDPIESPAPLGPTSRPPTAGGIPDQGDALDPPSAPFRRMEKSPPVPDWQLTPIKRQIPNVTNEPTPAWGRPWRKGRSCSLSTDY